MTEIAIYHNRHTEHEGHLSFFTPACERCVLGFEYAYHYDGERSIEEIDELLDLVWRDNNRVHGDEIVCRFGTRSLSVGDVVVVDASSAWAVDHVGWSLFESGLVEREQERVES